MVKENNKPKAIGAGLLSSIGELSSIGKHPHRPFDPEVMAKTDFDPTQTQPFYFCAESSEVAVSTLVEYLNVYLRPNQVFMHIIEIRDNTIIINKKNPLAFYHLADSWEYQNKNKLVFN